jgi:hypothetical protein
MKQLIEDFREQCRRWNDELASLPEHLAGHLAVFNERLLKQDPAVIRYILIGDNPGKEERKVREYFVGGAGMTARLFFERYLVSDFDRQVLCLNKTPIHTNVTTGLEALLRNQQALIRDSQTYMANLAYTLHKKLQKPVVVCGFGGCRTSDQGTGGRWALRLEKPKTGTYFFQQLRENFRGSADQLYLVKHFSHDKFFEDFNIQAYWNDPEERFLEIGTQYRRELLG